MKKKIRIKIWIIQCKKKEKKKDVKRQNEWKSLEEKGVKKEIRGWVKDRWVKKKKQEKEIK